mgnify:CR=1 FL=1|jgi:hypothetical protein
MKDPVKFSREMMKAILYGDRDGLVSDELYDTSRWSELHEIVFEYMGTTYMTYYQRGLTESQSEMPWENESRISCFLVKAVEVTKIEYQRI